MFTMMLTAGAALLLCLMFTGVETQTDQDGQTNKNKAKCDLKFSIINANHTMCLTDKPNAVKISLSENDRSYIVDKHNEFRRNANPIPANMLKMQWSSELAEVAQKWAMQCPTGHEDDKNKRAMPSVELNIGQNIAITERVDLAIHNWMNTYSTWTYGELTNVKISAMPYVQQIWASAGYIGCGYAKCGDKKYFVCDYSAVPTIPEKPYVEGTRCSLCPDNCEGWLCYCKKPRTCLNGGTFNIDTCQCDCVAPKCGFKCGDDCSDTDA